jgi:hypothetical protein
MSKKLRIFTKKFCEFQPRSPTLCKFPVDETVTNTKNFTFLEFLLSLRLRKIAYNLHSKKKTFLFLHFDVPFTKYKG